MSGNSSVGMNSEGAIPGLGLFAKSQTDIQTRQACAIYLPERPGEGKRNVVERRHNIIIADKTVLLFCTIINIMLNRK
jgi:hypothetical protein